jgi:hypothetical protein
MSSTFFCQESCYMDDDDTFEYASDLSIDGEGYDADIGEEYEDDTREYSDDSDNSESE